MTTDSTIVGKKAEIKLVSSYWQSRKYDKLNKIWHGHNTYRKCGWSRARGVRGTARRRSRWVCCGTTRRARTWAARRPTRWTRRGTRAGTRRFAGHRIPHGIGACSGEATGKDLQQRVLVSWTVPELDNDVVGLELLRVVHNLKPGEIVGTASSWTDEIIQTVLVGDTQIRHVGILLSDAQSCGTGEPPNDRIGGIVLPPQHQIGGITVVADAEPPSVLAQALADADALPVAVVFDLHGAAVRTSDGGPSLSSHAAAAATIVPVELIRIAYRAREHRGGRFNGVVVCAEGVLEEILLPVGERLLRGGLDDGIGPGPNGATSSIRIGCDRFGGDNTIANAGVTVAVAADAGGRLFGRLQVVVAIDVNCRQHVDSPDANAIGREQQP